MTILARSTDNTCIVAGLRCCFNGGRVFPLSVARGRSQSLKHKISQVSQSSIDKRIYCRFLIKCTVLISAYNCERHYLRKISPLFYSQYIKLLLNFGILDFIFSKYVTKHRNLVKYLHKIRNLEYNYKLSSLDHLN